MSEKIKGYLNRNVFLYYSSQFIAGLRFMAPVWVLFFSHYISFAQLTILESLGLFIGLILELPTGVFADLVGRKTSVVIGYFAAGLGFVMIGLANNFWGFLYGYIVNSVGETFVSGASTALLFDTLKEHSEENNYSRYSGNAVSLGRLAIIIAMVAGQYLYTVYIGLPYVAVGIAAATAGLAFIFMQEPHIDTEKFSFGSYLNNIKSGAKEAFKDERTTKLSLYFLVVASIELLLLWFYYAPYLTWLGYTDKNIGWIYAAIAGTRMVVSIYSAKIESWIGDKNVILGLPLILGIVLSLGFVRNMLFGTILLFIHYSLFTLRYTSLDKYTNLRFSSKYRASALSTLSMLVSVVYAVVILIGGKFINYDNVGSILTVFGLALLFVGLPIGYTFLNSKKTISTS